MLRVIILLALLGAALGYALWRGGAPERAMAALWLCLLVADPILHFVAPLQYHVVDAGHLIIDLTGYLVATGIAITAYRFWPLLVAVLQFLPLLGHLSRAVDLTVHPSAYMIMQVASYWPLAPLLVAGTWAHHRRLQKTGTDPDWQHNLVADMRGLPGLK